MSVAIGLLDPRSDLRSAANPDYGSCPHSRDCRHESVRKESPCCHRVVQGLRTISAKIGVSNPGSITQFFAEMEVSTRSTRGDEARFATLFNPRNQPDRT